MDAALNPSNPELLLAHADFVRQLASRLVFDESSAQDVVQETLISALEHPPREDRPLRAWLAKVARNHVLQIRRAERRRVAREERSARGEGVPSTADIVERESARKAVVEAVLALGEPYRATILLRFYEDLPPREVARRMGIPVETVRTRTKRGLALLRGRLDESYDDDRAKWSAALLPLALSWRQPSPARTLKWLGAMLGAVLVVAGSAWLVRSRASVAVVPAATVGAELAVDEEAAALADERALVATPQAPRGTLADAQPMSSVRGSTVDERGEPLAGVEVIAFASFEPEFDDDLALDTRATTRSDALGRFELSGLPDRFFLHARDDAGRVAVAGFSAAFGSAQASEDVELHLARAFNAVGRVVDSLGQPIADAAVRATTMSRRGPGRAASDARTSYRALVAYTTESDGQGRFTLRRLPPVKHYVSASAPGYLPSTADALAGGGELEIVLEPDDGSTASVGEERLAPVAEARVLAPLSGFVIDAATRLPVTSCVISHGARGQFSARENTSAEGRFDLGEVDWSATLLAVRAPGFAPWSVQLRGRPPARELYIELQSERELTLRVVDARGEPVANARLVCANARGRPLPVRVTDEYWNDTVILAPDGRARLYGLPAALVRIEVRVPQIAALESFEFDLAQPRSGVDELRLPVDLSSPRHELEIELVDARADEALVVEVLDARGEIVASARLEPGDGRLELARPLRYLVERYDATGALAGRSQNTLSIDSLVQDHGPRLVRKLSAERDALVLQIDVPTERASVVARADYFGTRASSLSRSQARVELDLARR